MPEVAKTELISTEYWAILFGALVSMIALIQFGEAVYSYAEVSQRDDEVADRMAPTMLQQLVMAVASFVIGIFAVLLWKYGPVNRSILGAFGLIAFIGAVYVLAVLFQQRIVMVDLKKSPVRELRAYSVRTNDVMFGDIVLFGLQFSFALLMLWLYTYADLEEYK